jgi:hypothetical protein
MNKFLKVFTETVEKYGKYTAHHINEYPTNSQKTKK